MKKTFSILVRLVVSFGLLGLLFWLMRDEIKNILGIIAESKMEFILIAAVVILINVTLLAYRLKVIFLGENLQVSLKEALELTYIGYFFNNFMPTAVGGDIIKAHYASIGNDKKIQSYASVLMDRILGLYTFLIVAAVALVVDRGKFSLASVRFLVSICVILGAGGIVVATNKRIAAFMERFLMRFKMLRLGEKLHGIYSIVHDYRNRKDVVVKSFFISIFSQCFYFIAIYLFFVALGTEISLGNIFLIMPVVTFMSMIPSIGGLGVREGAIVMFFSPLVGREMAFAMGLLFLAGLFFISLIGGIIYLWWSVSGRNVKTEQ